MLEKTLDNPLDCKEIHPSILKEISPECSLEDWCWSWNSSTLDTWCKELTHWKRPWCWERLKTGGEGDDRGWDGWMASPIQWRWVWVNSGSWWWTGRPGMLQSMGPQRVGHYWVTQLNWTEPEYPDTLVSHLTKLVETSLVVQWLRVHLPMQGTWVLSLVGKLRSHMPWGN